MIIGIKYKKDFLNAYKVLALLEVRNSELFAWLRPNLTPWSHHDFERIKKFREGLLRRLPRSCTHLREKLHKKNSLSGGYRQPFQTGKIQKVALIIQSYGIINLYFRLYDSVGQASGRRWSGIAIFSHQRKFRQAIGSPLYC